MILLNLGLKIPRICYTLSEEINLRGIVDRDQSSRLAVTMEKHMDTLCPVERVVAEGLG